MTDFDFDFSLKVSLVYDQSFLSRFGNNSLNRTRSVIAHVQPIFFWPSLTVRLRLDVKTVGIVSLNIKADQNEL